MRFIEALDTVNYDTQTRDVVRNTQGGRVYTSSEPQYEKCFKYIALKTRAHSSYLSVDWADDGYSVDYDRYDNKIGNKKTDEGITITVDNSKVMQILLGIIESNADILGGSTNILLDKNIPLKMKLMIIPYTALAFKNMMSYCKDYDKATSELMNVCNKINHNNKIVIRQDKEDIGFTIVFEDYTDKKGNLDTETIKKDVNKLLNDISKSLYMFVEKLLEKNLSRFIDYLTNLVNKILETFTSLLKIKIDEEENNMLKDKEMKIKEAKEILKRNGFIMEKSEKQTLTGTVVFLDWGIGSKSSSKQPFLKTDNETIRIYVDGDNPFENETLKEFNKKRIKVTGTFGRENIFTISEII